MGEFISFLGSNLQTFWEYTGYANATLGNWIMILVGLVFIYLAVTKEFEPMLLVPIGFGILVGNVPFNLDAGLKVGIYESNSVFNILYGGVTNGWYPPLIFLGIGAMTDFSALISQPRLVLIGAAAQFGIFGAYMLALLLGFDPQQAGAIGIIGGADGPTAIFLTSKLAPHLLGPIAVAAYSYMALVPFIQPPIIKALTSKKDRMIHMAEVRQASKTVKILFPIIVCILASLLVPDAASLLGMLMLGNLFKECGVTERLTKTAGNELINIVTIFLGLAVGSKMSAEHFLTIQTIMIICMGLVAFCFGTAGGVLLGQLLKIITKGKVNPMIGAAGVSAVPMAARVVQKVGQQEDPSNFLLMNAMGPNVAGVIGSAVAAGILLSLSRG